MDWGIHFPTPTPTHLICLYEPVKVLWTEIDCVLNFCLQSLSSKPQNSHAENLFISFLPWKKDLLCVLWVKQHSLTPYSDIKHLKSMLILDVFV